MAMALAKLIMPAFLLLITAQTGQQQQQCSVDNLPEFGDTDGRDTPDTDRFQAIVPAYRFQCAGRVTEWRACVQPGGSAREQYYIQFQVWRPTDIGGCYKLVDYNIPMDEKADYSSNRQQDDDSNEEESDSEDHGIEGFVSPPGDRNDPLDRCVVLPVEDSQQIEVQPGDVVGYYVDHFRDGDDRTDGGIQWIANGGTEVVVYYTDDIPRADIKTEYGIVINGLVPSCGFVPDSSSSSHTISSSANSVPIISLSLVLESTSTVAPTITPTSLPVTTLSLPITTKLQLPPSDTSLPKAPSVTREGENGITPVIVAVGLTTLITAIVTALVCLIIVIVSKRIRGKKSSTDALDNPAYETTALSTLKLTGSGKYTASISSNASSSSTVPYYDYCSVPVAGSRCREQPVSERLHATPDESHRPPHQAADGISHNYSSIESIDRAGEYDSTVVYEDLPSPSYASQVCSTGSVFDRVGTCVPTVEERARYETASEVHQYNTLQFFEQDHVFWAPASTASGLYEQLCSKRYREINGKQIRVLEKIGSGQFGTVSKGLWTYDGESMQVAVKVLNSGSSEGEKIRFLQEAAILGQFSHPNIVRLHGVVTVGEPAAIVLEFMPKGDVKSYLDDLVIRTEDQAWLPSLFLKFGREIAAGMAYLAKKSFVHRDLAARNILLDQRMSCKIGDFGMARDLMDNTYYKSSGGKIPVKWTAPEALLYKKYSTASDVWSYAMVLYEIWSVGQKPFQQLNNSDMIARLQNHLCQAPPPGCPRMVYALMVDCWNPDPHCRPSFESVCCVLRRPEELLLHWSEEDRAAGRSLLRGPQQVTHSFSDLQNKYTAQ